jgi:hypothetical protein
MNRFQNYGIKEYFATGKVNRNCRIFRSFVEKKLLDNLILNYFEELAAVRNSRTMSGILRIFGVVDSELFLLSDSSPSAERAATWATQSTAKYQKGYSKTSKRHKYSYIDK